MSQIATAARHVQDAEERLSLLEAISSGAAVAFDELAPEVLRERIDSFMAAEGVSSPAQLLETALGDPDCLTRLLRLLGRRSGPFDGYPAFADAFSTAVVPLLKTYPSIRVWLPACSTGMEAYLIAAVLEGAGIYRRSRIYATDVNPRALAYATQGVYPAQSVARSMQLLGEAVPVPAAPFAEDGANAVFAPWLRRNIIFAQHSLATDSAFNEFQVVIAHGRFAVFGAELARRARELFSASLVRLGFLCLDRRSSPPGGAFELLRADQSIYRKVRL